MWALFRAKTHDGPLVLTSTYVMWRPKGKEETTQLDLETLAKCDLQERKGKKIVFSHKTLPGAPPLPFPSLPICAVAWLADKRF